MCAGNVCSPLSIFSQFFACKKRHRALSHEREVIWNKRTFYFMTSSNLKFAVSCKRDAKSPYFESVVVFLDGLHGSTQQLLHDQHLSVQPCIHTELSAK